MFHHGMERRIMAALDNLKSSVARIQSQDASIIALCQGLANKLHEANVAGSNDPAIQDIANQLGQQADAIAAAVLANTPADPNADGGGQPASDANAAASAG